MNSFGSAHAALAASSAAQTATALNVLAIIDPPPRADAILSSADVFRLYEFDQQIVGGARMSARVMCWVLLACFAAGCDDETTPAAGDARPDAAPVDGAVAPDADDPDAARADADPDAEVPADRGVTADTGGDAMSADAAADADPDAASACDPACTGAQRCAAGACVEPATCQGDLDCLPGRHCEPGAPGAPAACADDCFEDAACPGGRTCDLATGRCPEAAPCRVELDCDPGRACVDGACADLCGPENPCPGAQTCDADGRCAEPVECRADADCLGDRLCVDGACDDRCREDADCPGTRRCDPVSGRCPEPAACFAAADCDPGRACDRGVCAAQCIDDAECPGRQQCGVDGLCVEPAACEADLDCRGARFCEAARCTDPCREDADCPGALRCLADGRCGEAPMGCARDADCLGDRVCAAGLCADPECEENRDCPAGACVDRRCGAVPVGCAADAACPGERCAPIGVCADPAPCAADGDCGGLRPICLRGRCAACAGDLDCTASEFCADGACVFFGGCQRDADCPGRRQCGGDVCQPAPCAGDAYDGGGGGGVTPTLAARTYTGLVLCDGDLDRYRVALAAGEGLAVTARFDRDAGELGLRLTAPGAPALVYAETTGGPGFARVGLPASPAPQTLDVEVFGRAGYSPAYQLTIERLPPDRCPPDPLEGPFGDDTPATATPIGPAPVTVTLCPGDTDHLAFDAAPATALIVTATGDAPLAALAIDLLDPAGRVIAAAAPEDRALTLRETLAAGRHTLRLAGAEAPLTVDLTLDAAAAPGADAAACAAAPAIPLPRALPLLPTLPVDRFESTCARGFALPDHVARFRLDRRSDVTALVYPDDRQTVVSIRRACADPATEAACTLGAESGPVPLDAGDWYVIVESSGAVPQTVELQIR
ncbi:MAG: hypothetical protein R3F65_14060 [bacterium]